MGIWENATHDGLCHGVPGLQTTNCSELLRAKQTASDYEVCGVVEHLLPVC